MKTINIENIKNIMCKAELVQALKTVAVFMNMDCAEESVIIILLSCTLSQKDV